MLFKLTLPEAEVILSVRAPVPSWPWARLPEPWRLRLYLVTQWQGEPEARQEHAQLRWCSLDEAQQRLAGAHVRFPELLARALAAAGTCT